MKTPMTLMTDEEKENYLKEEEHFWLEEEIKDYMGYADPPTDSLDKDKKRAKKRQADVTHALRKRNKDRKLRANDANSRDWYDNLHEYSKGKIHCSCPLCRVKTNDKNAITNEPPFRDKKKLVKLQEELKEIS